MIRPLLQILSRQLKPGFSQVKIYLKKNLNVWPDSLVLFLFFVSLTTLYFFLNVFLPFYVSATINDIFVLFFEIVMPMLTFFLSFFLPRIWKITSELPGRSPTQMRINQDMAKGKFTLNSIIVLVICVIHNIVSWITEIINLKLTLTIVSVYTHLCRWPHRQL